MENQNEYLSPFNTRYCSPEMKFNFSNRNKFENWRRLWIILAEAQIDLGVQFEGGAENARELLDKLKNQISLIDFEKVDRKEKEIRHDVMAHLSTFAESIPGSSAGSLLHVGATSCFVTDNADLMMIRNGFDILLPKLGRVLHRLSEIALEMKDIPTLGYTHYQAASLTTVGKRICLWIQDLLFDEESLSSLRNTLRFRGAKGATGTQAGFMRLFPENPCDKVRELDSLVSSKAGFNSVYPITGQTYSRKIDISVVSTLSSLGASIHKICTDIRLLAHDKEMEEPFEKSQIGSSAMAYKRNPMRCERACGLSRYLMSLTANTFSTLSTQWLERSLDDSANRRITLSEAFLCADAILEIMQNISEGLVFYPKIINKHIQEELPFMATENLIMRMVLKGADRQIVHEKIRVHSINSAAVIKQEGKVNDLLDRIRADEYFRPIVSELDELMNPLSFIGRAPEQVSLFIDNDVRPVVKKYEGQLAGNVALIV